MFACYNFSIRNTTKLSFDDKKVYGKTGLINRVSLESPLNKVNDVTIRQSLFGLIFNYATVIISTSSSKYKFYYIKDAEQFRKLIFENIDSCN